MIIQFALGVPGPPSLKEEK